MKACLLHVFTASYLSPSSRIASSSHDDIEHNKISLLLSLCSFSLSLAIIPNIIIPTNATIISLLNTTSSHNINNKFATMCSFTCYWRTCGKHVYHLVQANCGASHPAPWPTVNIKIFKPCDECFPSDDPASIIPDLEVEGEPAVGAHITHVRTVADLEPNSELQLGSFNAEEYEAEIGSMDYLTEYEFGGELVLIEDWKFASIHENDEESEELACHFTSISRDTRQAEFESERMLADTMKENAVEVEAGKDFFDTDNVLQNDTGTKRSLKLPNTDPLLHAKIDDEESSKSRKTVKLCTTETEAREDSKNCAGKSASNTKTDDQENTPSQITGAGSGSKSFDLPFKVNMHSEHAKLTKKFKTPNHDDDAETNSEDIYAKKKLTGLPKDSHVSIVNKDVEKRTVSGVMKMVAKFEAAAL
jgi:hypothetical protein